MRFSFLFDGSEVRTRRNCGLINVPDANKRYRHTQAHTQAHQRALGLQQVHVASEAVKGIQDKMLEINEGGPFSDEEPFQNQFSLF